MERNIQTKQFGVCRLCLTVTSLLGCILSVIITMSCSDNTSERDAMQVQIDSLREVNSAQASQLKEISDFMSVVSEGLDSIAAQEEQLTGNGKGVEGRKMTKEELRTRLDAFAALLERQRNRIAQLEDTLSKRGQSMTNLRNIINHLNHELDEKNRTIAALQMSLNVKMWTFSG